MFKNKKNSLSETDISNITTIIAEDCKIEGAIDSSAYMKIDGQALGGVSSLGGVILGQKGYIKGDIKTKELIVYGKIDGDVYADNLILKSTALISGNIRIKTLQVETGAIYKGTVQMDSNSESNYTETE